MKAAAESGRPLTSALLSHVSYTLLASYIYLASFPLLVSLNLFHCLPWERASLIYKHTLLISPFLQEQSKNKTSFWESVRVFVILGRCSENRRRPTIFFRIYITILSRKLLYSWQKFHSAYGSFVFEIFLETKMGENAATKNHFPPQVFSVAVDMPSQGGSKWFDDDGRPKRTGKFL